MNFRKTLTAAGIVGVVFIVYFGTATKWTMRPPWTVDYINPMGKALLQGRLDIPDPAMTYDLALYNGRWYMTWGALPAVVHIPLQFLAGGRYVPALYTSLLFGSLTVGILWQMLHQIRKDWFSRSPGWPTLVFTFLYAFGTMQFYLSTVGSIWQVNQVVSTFFGVLGTAMILKKKRLTRDYASSSLFYGVALLGRPTVGLLFVVPVFLFMGELWQKGLSVGLSWKRGTAILLPMLLAVAILLAYNTVRFGNPLETGHRFLAEAPELAEKRERLGMLSFAYVPVNMWHMIASPPRLGWVNGPAVSIDLMGNSIFFLSPLLLIAFWTLTLPGSMKREVALIIVAMWLGVALTAGASLLYYNTGWMQFGYRYALDFSFLLLMLVYFWFQGRIHSWIWPLLLYTIWINYTGILLMQ